MIETIKYLRVFDELGIEKALVKLESDGELYPKTTESIIKGLGGSYGELVERHYHVEFDVYVLVRREVERFVQDHGIRPNRIFVSDQVYRELELNASSTNVGWYAGMGNWGKPRLHIDNIEVLAREGAPLRSVMCVRSLAP
ncbi:hypothetical protein D1872_51160 [compost metagenome]